LVFVALKRFAFRQAELAGRPAINLANRFAHHGRTIESLVGELLKSGHNTLVSAVLLGILDQFSLANRII
jgi:hypothetical protein